MQNSGNIRCRKMFEMWQVVQRKEKTNTTYMQKMWYAHDIEKQRYCDCEKNYIWIERSKGREMKMREILFKAKRKDNGEWLEGYYFKTYGCRNGVRNDYHIIHEYEEDENYQIEENTLCQYTGLTDKNGNKIWENDVVNCKNENVRYDKNGIVKFGEYHSGFDGNANHIGFFIEWNSDCLRKDIGFWAKNREIEVVGNIFDNHELLGGGE